MNQVNKVAIACQGGGSHAAFTAGVLQRLLSRDLLDRYELVALSGTSGGAMCAALAWTGLLLNGPDDAIARLGAFWQDVKPRNLIDASLNFWGVWAARQPVTVETSPYSVEPVAEQRMFELVRKHIPLDKVGAAARDPARARLLIGAVDVLNGERLVFGSRTITHRHLVASAAVPPIFRALDVSGRLCWDGLFATNPPIREFTDPQMVRADRKPDEIWVIQINPQRRAGVPERVHEIVDRRNELSGNLALAQELYFIEKINELIGKAGTGSEIASKYQPIKVKTVELDLPLDYASKLDRDPAQIDRLMERGYTLGDQFLADADWRQRGSLPTRNVAMA